VPLNQPPTEDNSIKQFQGHTDSVFCVSFNHAKPNILATGGGDDVAIIWNTESNNPVHVLKGHTDSVSRLEFSVDGKLLATGGMEGVVKIWDVETGNHVVDLEGPGDSIECLVWHPKGNVLLAGSVDGSAFMWLAAKGTYMQSFTGHKGPITSAVFGADGKKLITASEDGTVRIWNPKTGVAETTISGHNFHEGPINRLAVHPHNLNLLATAGRDNNACVINLVSGKSLGVLKGHEHSVEGVAFVANLPLAVTGSLDKTAKVWDLGTMQCRVNLPHDDSVIKVLCHPKEPIVLTCSLDYRIRAWDVRTGQQIGTPFIGHKDALLDFDINADGTLVASASDDNTARLYSLSL
jgi:WD40 repeat protein